MADYISITDIAEVNEGDEDEMHMSQDDEMGLNDMSRIETYEENDQHNITADNIFGQDNDHLSG